nr:MAG TPA: translation initiation factor-like protein [Bacteriophage sp.]
MKQPRFHCHVTISQYGYGLDRVTYSRSFLF